MCISNGYAPCVHKVQSSKPATVKIGNVWTWSSQKMLTHLLVKLTPLAKHFSKCATLWKLHGVEKKNIIENFSIKNK
jgi:hypothetical protein